MMSGVEYAVIATAFAVGLTLWLWESTRIKILKQELDKHRKEIRELRSGLDITRLGQSLMRRAVDEQHKEQDAFRKLLLSYTTVVPKKPSPKKKEKRNV
jgi:hypothetical protein